MTSDSQLALALVQHARRLFEGQVRALTVPEALFPAGGWRSGLGVLKHVAAWLEVYHSYAFEPAPRHWQHVAWPRALIDTIDPSDAYLSEVVAWINGTFDAWGAALAAVEPGTLNRPAKLHWGAELPLHDVVVLSMQHAVYHLGECNMLLSIKREEAWEWTEEVEENHISTYGHSLRPGWMSDSMAAATEERLRRAHQERTRGHQ